MDQQPASIAPPRVLVVEDAPESVELLTTVLAREGYTTAVASSGPQAVQRAIDLSREKYCSATTMLGRTAEIACSFEIIEI